MTPEQIEARILEVYADAQLFVIDQTGSGSNFEVRIASDTVNQLPRLQRHQKILQLFAPEFATGEIHAMSIKPINLDQE